MPYPLTDCLATNLPPLEFLRSVGTIFAEFGANTQDSGNVSYGVAVGEDRFFVKTAGFPDDSLPRLDHASRVALLRNAVRLSQSVRHSLLPALHGVIESPDGPLLVYPWLDGELLGVPRERRDDPQSSFQRFRALPVSEILSCLSDLFDLHADLAEAGWIAGDFYDGSLLYDFASKRLWVIDLDFYRDAPFTNDMGRMPGSSRFMAPEEYEQGAWIDEQTTVYVMGRTALVFLADCPPALLAVAARACAPARDARFETLAAFFQAWQHAMPTKSSAPTLVLMAGLPGAGKTTLAMALGKELGWPVLDKDTVKTALLEAAVSEAVAGPASYFVPLALCRDLVAGQQLSVIFDSPAAYPTVVEQAQQIVEAVGGTLKIVFCQAQSSLRNQRLAQRTRRLSQVESDPTTDTEGFARFAHLPPERLDVFMERPIAELTAEALEYLTEIS